MNFVLWVISVIDITDVKRRELAALVTTTFMQGLVGGNVRSAVCRVVAQDEHFQPGQFDAVVFLTEIGFRGAGSIMKRAGESPEEAIANEDVKGLTAAFLPGGGIAEIYWNRCSTLPLVAAVIFHEAGHLKFRSMDKNLMHKARGSAGPVRVLATDTQNVWLPNDSDFEVFRSKISNVVPLRNRLP
jgi:hypothetical protein